MFSHTLTDEWISLLLYTARVYLWRQSSGQSCSHCRSKGVCELMCSCVMSDVCAGAGGGEAGRECSCSGECCVERAGWTGPHRGTHHQGAWPLLCHHHQPYTRYNIMCTSCDITEPPPLSSLPPPLYQVIMHGMYV